MSRRTLAGAILLLFLLSPLVLGGLGLSSNTQSQNLSAQESTVVSLVNGTSAYDYDLELERIALDHNISGYSFRSAGSPGADQTARWIESQFEEFGLETQLESFQFTNWYLPSQPTLVIDQDGNASTTDDQTVIKSFMPAHYSWPTPQGGVSSALAVLPLPEGLTELEFRNDAISPYVSVHWQDINTTGKIVLVGREVGRHAPFAKSLVAKLDSQPPAALIYTYWYDWMNFTPPMYGSMSGHGFWSRNLPNAWVNYEDGMLIRSLAGANTSAFVDIPAVIENGVNYNVVAKLRGKANPEKAIIISGHYDTVMDAGFCDNGAGTAGVIELARIFTEAQRRGLYTPEQTLIFVAFTGEELGFIGSINYLKQHEAELKNVNALINLDCIGQGNLTVSITFPDDNGLELDEIVLKAARDLGVTTQPEPEDPGGSDQETFRNPVQSAIYSIEDWGIDPGINDSARIKSSTMLGSVPLFYSDKWLPGQVGVPGWIHTEYDNSTSTETLNWVSTQVLGEHIEVTALSVMRYLSAYYNPFMSTFMIGAAIAGIIVAGLLILKRSKVKAALVGAYSSVTYYVESREMVYVAILMAFLIFSSYASYSRVGRVEVMENGVFTVADRRYFGYPFEMVAVPTTSSAGGTNVEEVFAQIAPSPGGNTPIIMWTGLLLNVILFFLIAFGIVYLGARVKERYSS